MRKDFTTGVITGLVIYGVGILLTVIVHVIFGWTYVHGPPASALPLLLTLLVGAGRFFIMIAKIISREGARPKGELLVHVSVFLILAVLVIGTSYYY